MSLNFSLKLCLILTLTLLVLPFQARAISPSAISVNLAPENPVAGENTTITLGSFAANLDGIPISWFVSGRKITSGIGVKTFSLKAPAAGTETTVRAVIAMPDGEIEKKIIIRPSAMVLLWQTTDSYVPPFYRGKALPTSESDIKVLALPEIRTTAGIVNPKNMIYDWKKNYTTDATASGYSKNSFTFTKDYLEDVDNIAVVASTVDGKYSSAGNVNIISSQPQVSFYKKDQLQGTIWERALSDGHLISGEETVVAEPYFFSPKNILSPDIIWNWFINGNLTGTLAHQKNELPLKIEAGARGAASLRLEIENRNQILQTASKEIKLEF